MHGSHDFAIVFSLSITHDSLFDTTCLLTRCSLWVRLTHQYHELHRDHVVRGFFAAVGSAVGAPTAAGAGALYTISLSFFFKPLQFCNTLKATLS